nr:MAG TPA: hypothetical protein [Caudoviricetes sp.]
MWLRPFRELFERRLSCRGVRSQCEQRGFELGLELRRGSHLLNKYK